MQHLDVYIRRKNNEVLLTVHARGGMLSAARTSRMLRQLRTKSRTVSRGAGPPSRRPRRRGRARPVGRRDTPHGRAETVPAGVIEPIRARSDPAGL
jgi:hypothetical protein